MADEDNKGPAAATKVSDMEASGAIMEPGAKAQVDFRSPSVDNNPRAGTTADQNRIDFNDPTKTVSEAVADALGMKSEADPVAPKTGE